MTATRSQTDRPYDALVFIGRFQPFHLGHKAVIDRALELADRVVVLIGSARRTRSMRNPLTWNERSEMILGAYAAEDSERLLVTPLRDAPYSDPRWAASARQAVGEAVAAAGMDAAARIGLIGGNNGESGYYLNMFPDWPSEDVAHPGEIDATGIREAYLRALAEPPQDGFTSSFAEHLPASSVAFLENFATSPAAAGLAEEWRVIDGYRRAWSVAPYPPTFVTADAVVVRTGELLVIRRKFAPGRGRLALPGGFLEPFERLEDGAVRELAEETQISLSPSRLKAMITARGVFDEPFRSDRGRSITHGFLFEIPDDIPERVVVQASDDAEQAFWVPIADLDPEAMFEDHWDIVHELLAAAERARTGR